jgi:divalent metal cation (Fe/Co/Zn/Cd) transporter
MVTSPKLSNSISMHPHPFHLYPSREETATPTAESSTSRKHATSTAIEAIEPAPLDQDPIARHPTTHSTSNFDVEGNAPPHYTRDNDPYELSSKLKSASELESIRANTSRKRDGCGPITFNSEASKARKLRKFYEGQNESIQRLLKPVDEHIRSAKEFNGENHLKFKIAVHGSFAANVLLAILQVYGAASSGSLSLFTTMADALFDPMSNITLIVCNRAVQKVDPRRFPSGKARIETAGNIVFCFLMTSVSFILIAFSIMELVQGVPSGEGDTKKFHLPSVIAVAIAFCTKLCLFLYCWALRNVYSQIRILWEDHRNDLFINGFGILTSVGGSKLAWWIDPMGAIILSCLIATLWLRTAYSEFQLLIGVTAETQMQQWITYICKYSPFAT